MAKHNAYMQFWIGDYLADTPNLSTQRHGTYFLMIMYYWKHSELPSDLDELYEITKTRNEKGEQDTIFIRDKYFNDGAHKRLDQELAKALESYTKRVDAQKKSLEKRKENSNATSNANEKQGAKHMQSSDSDSDFDNDVNIDLKEDRFEEFWNLYPKGHKSSKKGARAKWDKQADKHDIIIADVTKRIADDDRWKGGYVTDVITYFNQERWDGDVYKDTTVNKPADKVKRDGFKDQKYSEKF